MFWYSCRSTRLIFQEKVKIQGGIQLFLQQGKMKIALGYPALDLRGRKLLRCA